MDHYIYYLSRFVHASSQDGSIGRYTVPPHTTKRSTTYFKTKKQSELPKNQTVWKSDN